MARAIDCVSTERLEELTALAEDAMQEGGHVAVHKVLTAEFLGDDWAEEDELLNGTEHWYWEDQAFYRRLVSSRMFTMAEKYRFIEAYPLSDEMIALVERVMWSERRLMQSIIGEIIEDVDRKTIGTLSNEG